MNTEIIKEEIRKIWEEILESEEPVENDESFFEIGGNSMLATLVIEQINEKYSLSLELNDIYENNTVEEISEYVSEKVQGNVQK